MHIIYTQKSLIYILVYYYGVQYSNNRHVRWLVSGLVWAGWCWFIVREKHCWLAGLSWLKPTSEHAEYQLYTYKFKNISCIRKKTYSLSLLNFSGTIIQPNRSSLYLPREANFIEIPGNTFYQASNTGLQPNRLLVRVWIVSHASKHAPRIIQPLQA